MKNTYIKSLLLAACFGSTVLYGANAEVQRSINTTTDSFSVEKQQYEAAILSYIDKGNALFAAGNFKDAAANYVEARLILEALKSNSAHFTDLLEKTKEMIAKSYYNLAQKTAVEAHEKANSSDIEGAIAYCKEAIAIYPACEKEMLERIEEYKKMLAATIRNNSLTEAQVIPDLSEKKYQIAILLKQAKMLYYTHQYVLARQRYKEVLLLDKVCPEAIQGLRATNVQLEKIGNDRFRITHKKQMAEAAWEGAAPIIKHNTVDIRDEFVKNDDEKSSSANVADDDTRVIREKLQKIVIPRVNFNGTTDSGGTDLMVAIKNLRESSKRYDPEGTGVNIYLYYPQEYAETEEGEEEESKSSDSKEGEDGENEDGEGEDGENEDGEGEENSEESSSSSQGVKYPQVNLDLYNQPLIKIIEDLAKAAKLKYKIEKNCVLLAPENAQIDDMQIKVFPFDESLLDGLGGDPDPAALQNDLASRTGAGKFPIGSNVMYDPRFRSLIVLNTAENIAKIHNVLMDIRKQAPQPMVQVQVKFVEVEQSDLKELGFIQSLSRANGDNGETNGRLQFANATSGNSLNNSGRNTFSFSHTFDGGYDYNLVINAVNQMDSKDVLSSPKILTIPNRKVTIKMTSERYFQWDYEEGEYDVNTADNGATVYSYTPPWPEFEKQELGITMEITPKIDTAKRLIMLDIHPWVSTLVGWTEYKYQVSAENNTQGGVAASKTESITRPIIAERTTDTNVVVYDNETVVVGGIIKDYTVTVDDKIPVLGDIPLLGRFFQSKSSTVKKTNLLIFVTARMLKPDGTPYFATDSTGGRPYVGIGDVGNK